MTDPIHPASGDLEAVAMPSDDEIRAAIKATEYKYFGDYEMSVEQFAAVDVLAKVAQAALSPASHDALIARVRGKISAALGHYDDHTVDVADAFDEAVKYLREALTDLDARDGG